MLSILLMLDNKLPEQHNSSPFDSLKETFGAITELKNMIVGDKLNKLENSVNNKPLSHKEYKKDLTFDKQVSQSFGLYIDKILTSTEKNNLINIFPGKDTALCIQSFLEERKYIDAQLQKGNKKSQEALEEAFGLYDNTTNIELLLEEFYTKYKSNINNPKYITQYYEKLSQDIVYINSQKTLLSKNTPSTRIIKKPTPAINQYTQEEQSKKTTGLAYDINKETDPLKKTSQAILSHFRSSGVMRNPKTKTTLCARTARDDAKRLFHVDLPANDAFAAMRSEIGDFEKSIVSDRYISEEKAINRVDAHYQNNLLGSSEFINKQTPANVNVADLYVTSSTKKGKIYGHRALMFRISEQWYVLDPYTATQPGEDKNEPRTLESYSTSMVTGGNKREFMRMNFYQAPVSLDSTPVI